MKTLPGRPCTSIKPGGHRQISRDSQMFGRKPCSVLVALQIGFTTGTFWLVSNSVPHELVFIKLRFLVEAKSDSRICLRQISTRSFCAFDNSWL